ncbi:MAG: type I phosphomannose isomerase catalytic subunit [Bdellovibrionota bacterium]
MTAPLYKLKPTFQNYAWGKIGRDSLVGRLAGVSKSDQIPYAELWLGAHPKSPSLLILGDQQIPLDHAINNLPNLGIDSLQFLFKFLSIREALSIQVHPDKQTAIELHSKDPEHYPDENYKPEVAVAITPVTMLYGFRSLKASLSLIENYPELSQLLDLNNLSNTALSIKELFSKIIQTPAHLALKLQQAYLTRIEKPSFLPQSQHG